jgi:thiol-disulfide isomerase/thioredoxin
MKRRNALLAVAGVTALAGGLGWKLWRSGPEGEDAGDLWTLRFPRPAGGELLMADLHGKPVLLNFWATWCPPCIKEMPALDRFQQRYAKLGWQVVGLAVDGPTPVRDYLQRLPVSFAIGLAGFDGTEISRRLGNASGALPFSAVFNRDGRLIRRKLGQSSDAELDDWAKLL